LAPRALTKNFENILDPLDTSVSCSEGFLSAGKANIVTQNSLTGTAGVSLLLLVPSDTMLGGRVVGTSVVVFVPFIVTLLSIAIAESVIFAIGTVPFITELLVDNAELFELETVSFIVPLKLLLIIVVLLTMIVLFTYVIFPGTLALDIQGIVTVLLVPMTQSPVPLTQGMVVFTQFPCLASEHGTVEVALATHKMAPLLVHSDVVPVGHMVPLSPIQPTMVLG